MLIQLRCAQKICTRWGSSHINWNTDMRNHNIWTIPEHGRARCGISCTVARWARDCFLYLRVPYKIGLIFGYTSCYWQTRNWVWANSIKSTDPRSRCPDTHSPAPENSPRSMSFILCRIDEVLSNQTFESFEMNKRSQSWFFETVTEVSRRLKALDSSSISDDPAERYVVGILWGLGKGCQRPTR